MESKSGCEREPNFKSAQALLPAIIQDYRTLEVLMLGYMNREAFEKTVQEKRVTFFSRSKGRLWTKGETSGHFLNVMEIHTDCDQDAILILATPEGPACHTGSRSCFETAYNQNFLFALEQIVADRFEHPVESSYTNTLRMQGLNKIAQKVGEEAVETIVAALAEDSKAFLNEACDLVYHLLVLLREKKVTLAELAACLEKRHKK